MGIIYIVGTPIGNLKDITLRALDVFREVDFILCEDTRNTAKLLFHYGIKKPMVSYHQHSRLQKTDYIIGLLSEGKKLALVSDAGTPGISDPGNKLIEQILSKKPETKIISIPGPAALTAAASVSGFPTNKFLFLGFPPSKNKRNNFFQEIADSKHAVIFYESPFRIVKTLEDLKKISSNLEIVVCREISKKFETIYRGKVVEILEIFKKEKPRGEFTIVVKPNFKK